MNVKYSHLAILVHHAADSMLSKDMSMTTALREMSIEKPFYVDSWLQSFSSMDTVKEVIYKPSAHPKEG